MTYVALGLIFSVCWREWLLSKERDKWVAERQMLLQRIQAPQQAVLEHSVAHAPAVVPSVDLNDDADYWAAAQAQLLKLEREVG